MSKLHKDYFLGLYPPNERRLAEFAAAAQESHEAQARIEAPTSSISTPISRNISRIEEEFDIMRSSQMTSASATSPAGFCKGVWRRS
jgi:hypothetical protein